MNYYVLQKNNNEHSAIYGKYNARPVYQEEFVDLTEVAQYIQDQCSVKRSDVKAVIDELGGALKHYLKMGAKVKIEGLGIFKPTVSSKAIANLADWNQAEHLKPTRLLFTPEKVKVGKRQMAAVVADVTWTMQEVAVNTKGEALYGRKAVREAKNAQPEEQEGE